MDYTSKIVDKPWGYEYLIYQNEHVGLWYLNIESGERTSMHCHPNKNTGLVLLDGNVEVSFLNDSVSLTSLTSPTKLMIRRGLFHSSKASNQGPAAVLEIETPRNKHDLVRLEDNYGREMKSYEDKSFERNKTEECLWLEEPVGKDKNYYNFCNCDLMMECVTSKTKLLDGREDEDIIIFLKGGIFKEAERKLYIAQPGDVVGTKTLSRLVSNFDMDNEVIILSIRKANYDGIGYGCP